MEPVNPIKSKMGSFSKPEDLRRSVAAAEVKKTSPAPQQPPPRSQPAAPAQETVPEVTEAPAGPTATEMMERAEAERLEALARVQKAIEEEYKIEITPADLNNYIFKGRLSKTLDLGHGVKVTFQTNTPKELREVDAYMASFRESSKYTPEGLDDERAIVMLSYGWTHANDAALGKDSSSREAKIRQMGSIFVERVATAYQQFNMLLKIRLQERDPSKNS